MARDAGLRVREHLRVEDLLREARDAIETDLGADVAYLHIKRDGEMGLPVGHEHDWVLPDSFLAVLSGEADALFHGLFERNTSLVYQDITAGEGDEMPPPHIREQLRKAGIVSQVLVPFGAGSELLGIIVAARMSHGRPWTVA